MDEMTLLRSQNGHERSRYRRGRSWLTMIHNAIVHYVHCRMSGDGERGRVVMSGGSPHDSASRLPSQWRFAPKRQRADSHASWYRCMRLVGAVMA